MYTIIYLFTLSLFSPAVNFWFEFSFVKSQMPRRVLVLKYYIQCLFMCLMLCVSPNSNVYKKSYKFIHQSQINQFLNSHPLTTGDVLNQSSLGLSIYLGCFYFFMIISTVVINYLVHLCTLLPLYVQYVMAAVVLNSCCQIALRKAGFIYTCHQHEDYLYAGQHLIQALDFSTQSPILVRYLGVLI